MSGTQQPEALRLARKFEEVGFMGDHRFAKDHWCRQAAAELRHQHARIAELESQLAAIGAGGVEPLRKQASVAAHDALPEPAFYGRLEKHYFFLPKVEECKISNDGAIGFYTEQQVRALLAATQPAAQGMDAQDAARWRHTLEHRLCLSSKHHRSDIEVCASIDIAIAAQAKQGGASNG